MKLYLTRPAIMTQSLSWKEFMQQPLTQFLPGIYCDHASSNLVNRLTNSSKSESNYASTVTLQP